MSPLTSQLSSLFLPEDYFPDSNYPFDIYDIDKERVVELIIPGFKKENLNLQLNGEVLRVRGVRERVDKERKYIVRSNSNNMLLDLSLGVKVGKNYELQEAKYFDGVLQVILKRNDTPPLPPSFPIS